VVRGGGGGGSNQWLGENQAREGRLSKCFRECHCGNQVVVFGDKRGVSAVEELARINGMEGTKRGG